MRPSSFMPVLVLVLGLAGPVLAGEEPVVVELRSGERVEGVLLGFGERVYRIDVGGALREIREADVRRIEFVEPVLAEALLPQREDLPACFVEVQSQVAGPAQIRAMLERARKAPTEPENANFIDAAGGLREIGVLGGRERAKLLLSVHVYETSADAEAGARGLRREALRPWKSGRPKDDATELLHAGRVVAALLDNGVTPMAYESARKALVARLERVAAGEVRAERLPIEPEFRARRLLVPDFWLPAGLEGEEAGEGGYVYRGAPGSVELRLVRGAGADLGTFRTAWRAGEKAVTLTVAGDVPADAVAFFERFVEDELARCADTRDAKRVAPREMLLEIADVLPRAGEMPAWLPVAAVEVLDAVAIARERRSGETLKPSDTLPEAAAKLMGHEAVEWGHFQAREVREQRLLDVRLFRYGAAAAAEAAYGAWRKWMLVTGDEEPFEVFLVRNVVISVEDRSTTGEAAEAFRRALLARCERAAPGAARSERFLKPLRFLGARICMPDRLLAGGLRFAAIEWKSEPRPGTGDARWHWHARHEGAGGTVHVRLYTGGDADAIVLGGARTVWRAGDKLVALSVEGLIAEEAAASVERAVEDELARCADTRGARRVRSLVLALEEVVPPPEELPWCWKHEVLRAEKLPPGHERGLVERLESRYGTGRTALELHALAFATVEQARAFHASESRKAAARTAGDRYDVLRARNLVFWIKRSSLWLVDDAFFAALRERCERAGSGDVESERSPDGPEVRADVLAVPRAFLPRGFELVETRGESPGAGDLQAVSPENAAKVSMVYRGPGGTIVIRLITLSPGAEVGAGWHAAWVAAGGAKAVTIDVERSIVTTPDGELRADVIAWFERFVDETLARCRDTRDARRVGPAAGERLVSLEDVLPEPRDLPWCTGLDGRGKSSGLSWPLPPGGARLERLDVRYLAERGFVDVRASRLEDAAIAGAAYEKDVRIAGDDASVHGVVRAANVVVLVRAEGPAEMAESFWKALLDRCERAAPGAVRALKPREPRDATGSAELALRFCAGLMAGEPGIASMAATPFALRQDEERPSGGRKHGKLELARAADALADALAGLRVEIGSDRWTRVAAERPISRADALALGLDAVLPGGGRCVVLADREAEDDDTIEVYLSPAGKVVAAVVVGR